MMKSAPLLCAVLLAACTVTPAKPPSNPERPAALVGTWATPYGDTIVMRQDGSAQRRGWVTASYPAWRVIVDSTTHAAAICFDGTGIGNSLCGPLTVSGDEMTAGSKTYNRMHGLR